MTKIDIISGFLGAGKTTLIKKLLSDAYKGEQVVLIENEFGEIGIDGGFLKEAGIEIREMNSGCICCSLVGDFGKSLHEVVDTYHPDRILIEPSGVGKLSDVIKAVQDVQGEIDAELNSFTTVVDVTKCKIYRKNFGEFFSNQIEYAGAVILSRTDKAKPEKIQESVALLRELNEKAPIITTPIEQLPGEKILETMESSKSLEEELLAEVAEEAHEHEHEHCHEHEHNHEHEHEHAHEHCHEHEHSHEHEHHHSHSGLHEIEHIIRALPVSDAVKEHSLAVYKLIAEAESHAHGVPVELVHFHEVGAVDSIVDIVAAAVCADSLNLDEVYIPQLNEGRGMVRCQHGLLPIPVPAVTNIISEHHLKMHITNVEGELVTPTGAAIAAALRTSEQLPEQFVIEKVGIGAGKREYECVGVLRAMMIA